MTSHLKHTNDTELQILLCGDEDSDEYRRTAAHVETCEACQKRLDTVAGPTQLDAETRELLSDYPWEALSNSRTGFQGTDGLPDQAESLTFLNPPSHPEMLGRLGRYEIERMIGSGGMGLVLKAFDTELNRPVAIKVLAQHLAHSGAARQRFARESRAVAAVVHEHVVAIHNVEADDQNPFLVMQYVAGESLQARVDREGPLDAKEVMRIGIQAASGLAAAHEQGVIHRDVKPANILLEQGVERILLTDFGLARTVDDASLTHTGIIAGTPHYMSPEQANGDTIDQRTDLFSLGSVLYFMATGRPPFRAERAMGVLNRVCHDTHRPVWQVNSDIPDDLSDIIDRLLEKKASRRFASAVEVRESLVRLLARTQQHGTRHRNRVKSFVRQRPFLSSGAIVCLASVIVAGFMFIPSSVERTRFRSIQPTEPVAPDNNISLAQQDQAIAAESAVYSATAQEISARLQQLEATSNAAQFAQPASDGFWQDSASFKVRLDQLERDTFRDSSISSTKEER
ncbi:MAG: serine/threonine protein kinase [Planctomycetes bacterium]|nr:serine/threonine protein kinase [Planctomycetota bacterium]MCH9776497.1 serine/threonine protein kinase [Planctomycetota bacterium]MCH9790462.1 serine/threonine protein kinase [Planctomycetota bacterium]